MSPSTATPAEPQVLDRLDISTLDRGTLYRFKVNLITNVMGVWTWVPVIVARGAEPGPAVAITAAIHGNELNGIRIVQRLFERLRPQELRGTVIGVPVMNVPGYRENSRTFVDGSDLNRLMPGRERGSSAEVYAHRLVSRILVNAQYLVDLHTASFGRVNSVYVRTDLTDPVTARMAMLQHCQIIVHNCGADGTLRGAMASAGVFPITIEVGDPQRFQPGAIKDTLSGLLNLLIDLAMIDQRPLLQDEDPVIASHSYWIYTDVGGVLEVLPPLHVEVARGERIARVSSVFGDVIREYLAPEDGVVVGKSTNPVNRAGSRVLHLGVVGPPDNAALAPPRLAEIRKPGTG